MNRQARDSLLPPKDAANFLLVALPLVASIHPECKIFQQVMKDEARCLDKNDTLLPDFQGCAGIWDGLSCWPQATFGEVVTLPCPGFFEEITKIHGFLHRNCTPDVFWSEPFPPYSVACGFEEGLTKGPEDQKAYYLVFRHIYTAGYAISLASLITALLIFTCFRKFHCTRNYIHMHLFLSFILRAAAVFTKDAVLFSDDSMDHCLMSTVRCKAAVTFFQFSILANFFWLLVEGMYLQTLLVLALVPDKQYAWRFILVGWGAPVTVTLTWMLTRLYRQNTGCWDDDEEDSAALWIIKGPILATVLMNFSILLNVIRILVQKLQSSDTGGRNARNLVKHRRGAPTVRGAGLGVVPGLCCCSPLLFLKWRGSGRVQETSAQVAPPALPELCAEAPGALQREQPRNSRHTIIPAGQNQPQEEHLPEQPVHRLKLRIRVVGTFCPRCSAGRPLPQEIKLRQGQPSPGGNPFDQLAYNSHHPQWLVVMANAA